MISNHQPLLVDGDSVEAVFPATEYQQQRHSVREQRVDHRSLWRP
jgi:hypothetical protein